MRTWVRTGVSVLLLLGACQGRTSLIGRSSGEQAPSGGTVSLSARDLAPVDAYIGSRNAQWILGDDVEVDASREYFAPVLTVNATIGLVERTDTTRADATVVHLKYLGAPGTASVTTSPRVMIGTGLTITARRTLVVRLFKTRDASRPVVLQVRARGDASRGRREEVLERGTELVLGGELRQAGGRADWFPYR